MVGGVLVFRKNQQDVVERVLGLIVVFDSVMLHLAACRNAYRLVHQFFHALALASDNRDHRDAHQLAELLAVDMLPLLFDIIHHIDSNHHRPPQFHQLNGEIEVALDVGAVDDIDDDIRIVVHDIIPRADLLHRIGGKRIDSRQVHHCQLHAVVNRPALFFLHGDARPVSDILVRPGELVKQRGLTTVGITRQCDRIAHILKLVLFFF